MLDRQSIGSPVAAERLWKDHWDLHLPLDHPRWQTKRQALCWPCQRRSERCHCRVRSANSHSLGIQRHCSLAWPQRAGAEMNGPQDWVRLPLAQGNCSRVTKTQTIQTCKSAVDSTRSFKVVLQSCISVRSTTPHKPCHIFNYFHSATWVHILQHTSHCKFRLRIQVVCYRWESQRKPSHVNFTPLHPIFHSIAVQVAIQVKLW